MSKKCNGRIKLSELIKRIKIISFRYTNKVTEDNRKYFGVVAQELAEIFDPEEYSIVNKDSEGYYQVDYVQLVPLLVKQIQTLESRIKKLEMKDNGG